MNDERFKEMIDDLLVDMVITAIGLYDQIRYGQKNEIAFDTTVVEVLKQMGLEK